MWVCFITERFPLFHTMIIFYTIKWSYGNHLEIKGVTIGEERFGITRVTSCSLHSHLSSGTESTKDDC